MVSMKWVRFRRYLTFALVDAMFTIPYKVKLHDAAEAGNPTLLPNKDARHAWLNLKSNIKYINDIKKLS